MVPGRPNFSHFVGAYSIEAFTEVDTFKEMMDDFLRALKNTPPAPGHERVLYAGLAEAEEEQDRQANGIPLHKEVVEWFQDICNEMDIPSVALTLSPSPPGRGMSVGQGEGRPARAPPPD